MKNKKWLSEKDFQFIYSRVPRLCVDVVIKTEKGIVLTRRAIPPVEGTWCLPGGTLYFGETLFGAAKRIAKEETNLTVSPQGIVGAMEFRKEVGRFNHKRHSVSIAVLALVTGGKIKQNWQSSEIDFFKVLPKKTYAVHGDCLVEHKLVERSSKL